MACLWASEQVQKMAMKLHKAAVTSHCAHGMPMVRMMSSASHHVSYILHPASFIHMMMLA